MPFLIDGHNLIPHMPGLSLADADDELDLVKLLSAFAGRKKTRVEVYFDQAPPGRSGRQRYGRVTAVFVRQGKTADEALKGRLQQLGKQARNWTVVSEDHEVLASARLSQAVRLRSSEFARQLEGEASPRMDADIKEAPRLSEEEIDFWLEQFTGE